MSVAALNLSLETIDTCLRALGELPLKIGITAFNELAAQRQIVMKRSSSEPPSGGETPTLGV